MSQIRQRLPGERVFAVLMLLLSAFLLWTAVDISGFKSYTSAGSFPMAAAATMLVCALIIVAKTWNAPPTERHAGEPLTMAFGRRIAPPVLLWTTLAVVSYMLLLERVGFIVASYVFLVVTMRLLGGGRWVLNLVVSALTLAVIYVVFDTAFSVALPTGSWWQGVFR